MAGAAAIDNGRERLMRAMSEVRFDPAHWFSRFGGREGEAVQRIVLVTAPASPLPAGTHGVSALRQLTQDAAYQLK